MDYHYGSHIIYNIEYHFVWVTKYRYQTLKSDISLRVRELVRQTCEAFEITILVSVPPNMAPSEIMRRIKGRSTRKIFEEFPKFKGRYWTKHFWAKGDFCATVG